MRWRRVTVGVGGLLWVSACGGAPARSPAPRPSIVDAPAPTIAPSSPSPVPTSVIVPARPPRDPRIARLMRLAMIWGEIRFRHPYVFDRVVDLDGALTAAIPKVSAAIDEDTEAAAIGTMLAALNDPQTRVDKVEPETAASHGAGPLLTTSRIEKGVLVLTLGCPARFNDNADEVKRVIDLIGDTKSVVVDLRAEGNEERAFGVKIVLNGLAPKLVAHETSPPALRHIQHEGFAPQRGTSSGGFRTYFATESVPVYRPTHDKHPTRVAFIVNKALGVPDLVRAMQRKGDAVVVAQGATGEMGDIIALGEKHVVHVRHLESVDGDFIPDARFESENGAVDLAIATLLRGRTIHKAAPAPSDAHVVEDDSYSEDLLPSRERRLLGAFRLWNVIRLFYPYRALMDASWDDAFEDAIPAFERAATPLEYAQAVAAFAAHVPDSHIWREAPPSQSASTRRT